MMIFLGSIFFILLLLIIWYSFRFEPYNFKVEKIRFDFKNLPLSFDRIKIVQISDLHSKKFGRKEKLVLKIINQLNPDYIFITGDIIDNQTKTKDLDLCRPFWEKLGQQYQNRIFGVFGNHLHDSRKINIHEFKKLVESCGISILLNENKKLIRNGEYLYLIGVDDPRTKHHNLEQAMQGLEDNRVKILLAHSPEIIEDLKESEVDLILAGHTHGGQVRLPLIPNFWIPTRDRGKYVSGLYRVKQIPLYINRGIGVDLLPIRFNCPPEITLIELRKG